ncbi:dimethyl sulfoxide reductase anchor subunit family protein [Endozoicomonas ascidiicola]|uniref:dimethyl sulfoxide reductase anchor subunit family protein n=1 Tax=Endozoicomonas ascidiicola TaxID=1698521 RepID=UPI00082B8582|nr:DmsC/YnfH family molybdoenzyme membrane anchor subunit [Endozoicomonas ascidiicola]
MHELPLVFFTVFGQTAAGALILLMISKQLKHINEVQFRNGLCVSMALMCIGLLAGATHVGNPFRMINMLAGVGQSPMSNEIVAAGLFTGLGVLTAAGLTFRKLSEKQSVVLGWASAVAGLLFILSVPFVYQLETVSTWNTQHSTWQMLLTTLVGGGALALVFGATRLGGLTVLLGGMLTLIAKPDYLAFLAQTEPTLSAAQSGLWVFQSLMLVAGFALSAFMMRKPVSNLAMPILCAAFLVTGELAGRIVFYNLWTITM